MVLTQVLCLQQARLSPRGLYWDETLNIIKITSKNANIVGADINELAPIKGFNSYNFLVAKLAYKILTYKFLLN